MLTDSMADERFSEILGIPRLCSIQERQTSLIRLFLYFVLAVTVHPILLLSKLGRRIAPKVRRVSILGNP